jgi:urease accessory protein UreF
MRPSENGACRQANGPGIAQSQADNLLGDFSALLQQVGVRGMLPACDSPFVPSSGHITDLAALQKFLETYLADILLTLELPAIAEACGHVSRGETRELIALDQRLARETALAPFASASRQIGSMQLQRLRPLRDERTVQRYLTAVASGRAAGWHTLVYGLTLAVYSFPLRQGLLHYARETLSGLARAAAGPAYFFDPACGEMLRTILARLPAAVEQRIPACDSAFRSPSMKALEGANPVGK